MSAQEGFDCYYGVVPVNFHRHGHLHLQGRERWHLMHSMVGLGGCSNHLTRRTEQVNQNQIYPQRHQYWNQDSNFHL